MRNRLSLLRLYLSSSLGRPVTALLEVLRETVALRTPLFFRLNRVVARRYAKRSRCRLSAVLKRLTSEGSFTLGLETLPGRHAPCGVVEGSSADSSRSLVCVSLS